jgi:hypothetical protein
VTLLRSIENVDYAVLDGVLLVLDPGAVDAPRVRGSFACSGAGWVAAASAAGYLRVRLESHDSEPAAAPGERLDEMSLPFTGVTGGVPAEPLRLTAPGGATRATAAEPHFTFTPAGELFALQSEPPAVRFAGVGPRLIELPASARDSTIADCPIWESERHLLLASAGASDAVRVDMRTGECELAAMPGGVPAQPLFSPRHAD